MSTPKQIKISHAKGDRYKKILQTLSGVMPKGLSDVEIDIIAVINELPERKLTPEVRKTICSTLGISVDYLNNYIKRLRTKGIILNDILNPALQMAVEPDDKPHALLLVFNAQ